MGEVGEWEFQITPTLDIPVAGYIVIEFPLWNSDLGAEGADIQHYIERTVT